METRQDASEGARQVHIWQRLIQGPAPYMGTVVIVAGVAVASLYYYPTEFDVQARTRYLEYSSERETRWPIPKSSSKRGCVTLDGNVLHSDLGGELTVPRDTTVRLGTFGRRLQISVGGDQPKDAQLDQRTSAPQLSVSLRAEDKSGSVVTEAVDVEAAEVHTIQVSCLDQHISSEDFFL